MLGAAPAPASLKLSRRQQLQAQEGVAVAAAQPHSSSEGSLQHSRAASQGSACVSHRLSRRAAGSKAQCGLQQLAGQLCQQSVAHLMGCTGAQGIGFAVMGPSLSFHTPFCDQLYLLESVAAFSLVHCLMLLKGGAHAVQAYATVTGCSTHLHASTCTRLRRHESADRRSCAIQAPSGSVRAVTRPCIVSHRERGNANFLLRCCMWFAVTRSGPAALCCACVL